MILNIKPLVIINGHKGFYYQLFFSDFLFLAIFDMTNGQIVKVKSQRKKSILESSIIRVSKGNNNQNLFKNIFLKFLLIFIVVSPYNQH